jgi:hypothetical protein
MHMSRASSQHLHWGGTHVTCDCHTADYCPQLPGYTAIQGADSYGNDIANTCWSNKTMAENAAACNVAAGCVAFNMIGCLKYGQRDLTLNSCGSHHCLYVANSQVVPSEWFPLFSSLLFSSFLKTW